MAKEMNLNQGINIDLGVKVQGRVFGGPFKQYVHNTRRLVGIKMAVEIHHEHDFSVPTQDFSVPSTKDMSAGILYAIQAIADGNDVYVGCMGGIGRTGLFMGCMAKVMLNYGTLIGISDPVLFVRKNYMGHAIETDEQQAFVRGFDTIPALELIKALHNPPGSIVKVPVEVVKEVYLTPWDWAYRAWTGKL